MLPSSDSSTLSETTRSTQTPEPKPPFVTIPHDDSMKEKSLHIPLRTASTPQGLRSERARIRLASAFFALLTLGWGDGVTGTLLPYFERDFNLSFMTSSLLWVASASGYALGTISVEFITRFLGRGSFSESKIPSLFSLTSFRRAKPHCGEERTSIVGFSVSRCRFFTMALASVLHSMFFVIMGCRLGFPSMLVAYAISAFSRSFILATLNVYVSSTSKRGLGYMYGSWAIGAFGAPLVCQSVIATGIRWANFYFGSLVISAINTSLIVFAFRPTRSELQSDAEAVWSQSRSSRPTPTSEDLSATTTAVSHSMPFPTSNSAPVPLSESKGPRTYSMALKKPKLWSSAIFCMLYTGSESATQGFIVIYLLNLRNANPNTVGYVTSGFWAGMAISRFLWGYLGNITTFRHRKWIVQGCILVAACMHLLIWFVPSFIENAVSTAVVGLVYGPIYPANLATTRDLLPTEVHLVSMAVVAAFGSFGAALFPFITGTLSTFVGPRTLPYITVSQCVVMFCLWSFFPSKIPQQL